MKVIQKLFSLLLGSDLQDENLYELKERSTWSKEVTACIESLGKRRFTLKEIYEFEDSFQKLHPDNKHIRTQIRKELQKLRDEGYINFLGGGVYEVNYFFKKSIKDQNE